MLINVNMLKKSLKNIEIKSKLSDFDSNSNYLMANKSLFLT